ncbi:MAG TPA: transcriptional repressor LexA [Bryobacteraceae bacterium]|nr:transcriptional repressor LexA [Bryobacteraceae bacterium]
MPRAAALTTRQQQVLAFYQNRQRETGFVPTLQEVADHFGFKSPNSVRQHLLLIEKKGFVHRSPGRSRALVLVRQGSLDDSDSVHVPLLGRIPAGVPRVAQEDMEALLTLPANLFRGDRLFALRVRGTSMKGAGIIDGDIAVLDAERKVTNGAIAAVRIEDDATLKRVYRSRNKLSLKADNPAYPEIKVRVKDVQHVQILGLLIGIVRKI